MNHTFESLQNSVTLYIESLQNLYTEKNESYKLPLSDAVFCVSDSLRNKKFFQAIQGVVQDIQKSFQKDEIKVIDAGAGLGILGIYALIHGAKFVTFIEQNDETCSALKGFLDVLDFKEHESYEILCADATSISLSQKYHVLISETITIDFVSEDFLSIIEHLRGYLLAGGIIMPERFEMTLTSSQQEIQRFGFHSHDDFSSVKLPDTSHLTDFELTGTCFLSKDISLSSGDSMSFFNARYSANKFVFQ